MEISPSIYEHAARLIGETPWNVSRDSELLFQAHAAAYRLYHHTPIMPGIDIYNLEVEAYGAEIEKPVDSAIPAVRNPLFHSLDQIFRLPQLDVTRDGRIPMQITVARRLKQTFPDAIIRVPICGPFSIASNLLGFNRLILEVADQPEKVRDALLFLAEGQLAFAQGIKDAGVDATFFESAACPPMLSPRQFRAIELPALKRILQGMQQIMGRPIPCVIGGNTASIVSAMLETGTNYLICPFETNQAIFLEHVKDRLDVQIRINGDLRIIASGSLQQIRQEADRVMELCRNRPNSCLGTGALPYETPPENVHYLLDYVKNKD
ncbi:MAG: uroporphyrinogen decarboxylase family protein [Thermoguttaceae bacterium]